MGNARNHGQFTRVRGGGLRVLPQGRIDGQGQKGQGSAASPVTALAHRVDLPDPLSSEAHWLLGVGANHQHKTREQLDVLPMLDHRARAIDERR